MKICVIDLDSAVPEIVFGDERLGNLRRLMDIGLYGKLKGTAPSTTVIWDHLAREGKKAVIIGVAPNLRPTRINADPAELETKIRELVGEYPVDVNDVPLNQKDRLRDEIFAMSRKQWIVVKQMLADQDWDYFQFVDIGLERVQQGFWSNFDKTNAQYVPGNAYESVIPEYYQMIDEQIAGVMEMLDEQTILLVVAGTAAGTADHGIFLLAAPNCPIAGEYEGAQLADIAPTLLDLAGYTIPETMPGRSVVAGMEKVAAGGGSDDQDQLLHDRLAGLGYV